MSLADFGIIGLGQMGENLALQALEKGFQVAGFDPEGPSSTLVEAGLQGTDSPEKLVEALSSPRILFLYVPAGPVVDQVLREISSWMQEGDILLDGGNSYWGDSLRRQQHLQELGIHWIDCGTSGGISGARRGACFMVGGEFSAVKTVEPILKKLSVEGGYLHTGPPGTGHFAKLVHNGIEFGMLQAIGEGIDLLENHPVPLEIDEILRCWSNGSVIRSWLIDLMKEMYREENGLEEIPPYIEDTGEVNWLVNDALQMEVAIPVIAQSVMQLFTSRDDQQYWAKAIAMMRSGFGGHPFGEDEDIARERRMGRIGPYPDFSSEESEPSR